MTIQTLDIHQSIKKHLRFVGLPNEAACELVSRCEDTAKKCGQPFLVEKLSLEKHRRALCIGLTNGEDGIALFYISESGQYAWLQRDRIYIPPPDGSTRWTSMPTTLGCLYLLFASQSGKDHVKAYCFGPVSELRMRYESLHTPPPCAAPSKRKQRDDEDGGTSPVLHPQPGFTLPTSLSELGL